jgi:hypothetical protein
MKPQGRMGCAAVGSRCGSRAGPRAAVAERTPATRRRCGLRAHRDWAGVALLVGLSVWAGLGTSGTGARRCRARRLSACVARRARPQVGARGRRLQAAPVERGAVELRQPRHAPPVEQRCEPSVSARALLSALAEAPREGLDPADFGMRALRQQFEARKLKGPARPELDASRIAVLDVRFTASFWATPALCARAGSPPRSGSGLGRAARHA